jgi:hypothetical protein
VAGLPVALQVRYKFTFKEKLVYSSTPIQLEITRQGVKEIMILHKL